MYFQKRLLDIGNALSGDEVKALVFLCTDIPGRNLSSVRSATDLFSRLVEVGLLSEEQPQLLTELLSIINRGCLALENGLLTEPSSRISPYRKMLYNLSENLTDADLNDVKFLLLKDLPRKKLDEIKSTLDIWLEMEHKGLMNENNLGLLETIISKVCPMLMDEINQFKAQTPTSPATQETCRPSSQSVPNAPNQAPQSLPAEGTGSFQMDVQEEFPQSNEYNVNAPNTSMDSPSGFNGGGDCAALFPALSAQLKIEVVETMQCHENKAPSEPQTFQTTATNTEGLGTYPMTAAKRGICLIINNIFSGVRLREGTKHDEECLRKVFQWLGFEVEVRRDCEAEEMLSALRELAGRNHGQVDCVVCCVLSHGKEGSVCGVDERTVDIKELKEPFHGSNCASLAGKPKLFFIQACQGGREQKAVTVCADGPEDDDVCSDAWKASDSIPSDADFLLGMSTVPSYVSYRHRKEGSWFIQSLCQNLVQMVPKGCDLMSIMTKVNADVAKKTDDCGFKKQMPQPAFSLRRKVVFPIPTADPPSLPPDDNPLLPAGQTHSSHDP